MYEACKTYPVPFQVNDAEVSGNENWNIDSGATTSLTKNPEWMIDCKASDVTVALAAEGAEVKAEACGKVRMLTEVQGQKVVAEIPDVLYVPSLRENLLSVRQMVRRHSSAYFHHGGAILYDANGSVIGEASIENDAFVLKGSKVQEIANAVCAAEPKKKSSGASWEMWHKRLGHMNHQAMKKLYDSNAVRGFKVNGSIDLLQCESCIIGKMKCSPHNAVSEVKSTHPLELLHLDICGAIPVQSLHGSKYIFVIVDDATRRYFVDCISCKSQTVASFKKFKTLQEKQTGFKVKKIRSDNGTEICNSEMDAFCNEFGISHQKTVPYTPKSNAVVERAHQSIMNGARSLLHDAKLPNEFWEDAVKFFVYVRNTQLTKALKESITPVQKWSANQPNIKHYRRFGCLAFYRKPDQLRQKLDPKGVKSIFVGYSDTRKAYKLYDINSKKYVEARNVAFVESVSGGDMLKDSKNEQCVGTTEALIYDSDSDSDTYVSDNSKDLTNQCSGNDSDFDDNHEVVNVLDPVPGTSSGSGNIVTKVKNTKRAKKTKAQLQIDKQLRHEKDSAEQQRRVEMGLRPATRLHHPADEQACLVQSAKNDNSVPSTYKQVMKSPDKDEWVKAMNSELTSLASHKVWEIVDRPKDHHVIKSKWVFTKKFNTDGSLNKYKARLVAVGCSQRPGIDYVETYSPVVKMESLRIILALAAKQNYIIKFYDCRTAYLHAEVDINTIFMECPPGLNIQGGENKVCHLLKSLYGLAQSGRNFYHKVCDVFEASGLTKTESDDCVFWIRHNGYLIFVVIFIDDFLFVVPNDAEAEWLVNKLQVSLDVVETRGDNYLGLKILSDSQGISISQEHYVDRILEKYGMENAHSVASPGIPSQKLDDWGDSPSVDCTSYQEMIGSLLYLATVSRPDIAYPVTYLARFSKDPKQVHYIAVKRVLRYLKGTKNLGIRFNRGEVGLLNGVADASWDVTPGCKSYSGYVVRLGSSLVIWKSKKQSVVSLSTCEAETGAIVDLVKELMWVRGLLTELGFGKCVNYPIKVYSDSQSAIEVINNSTTHCRTKHFRRFYAFVRHELRKRNLELLYVSGVENVADFLTKNVYGSQLSNVLSVLRVETVKGVT